MSILSCGVLCLMGCIYERDDGLLSWRQEAGVSRQDSRGTVCVWELTSKGARGSHEFRKALDGV